LNEAAAAEGRTFKATRYENVPGLLTSHGGAGSTASPMRSASPAAARRNSS
jgi:hypothetical protein